jgi:hypothetical protein
MIRTKFTILTVLIIMLIVPLIAKSQNNTSSPYSLFGIGDLASIAYGRNLALGGSGLGIRDPYLLNLKNPASLTAIDSNNFLFEMGVNILRTYSSSVDYDEKYWDGNLTHIAIGHRYNSRIMASFGLMPYSNIGYRLRTMKSVEGEDSYVVSDREGSGGINKLFYSLGVKLSDHFSLGSEFGYYYGPVNETIKTWPVAENGNPSYYYSNTNYKGFSFKAALQYCVKLDKKGTDLTLGAYFSPGQKFSGKSEILIQQQYGSSGLDTTFIDKEDASSISVPLSYGAGLGLKMKGKYLLAADFEMSNWNSVNRDKTYVDQAIYSLGFEILPQRSFNYLHSCAYRFGYHYDSGYVQTKGYKIDDRRISIGMGFPIQKSASMLNLTVEAGQRGTVKMGLIRERYIKMTASFSLQELWFFQRKFE